MKRNISCGPWYDRFVMCNRFNMYGVGGGVKRKKCVRDRWVAEGTWNVETV